MIQNWNFINSGPMCAYDNMQIDLNILTKAIENNLQPTVRVYSWHPHAVSIGRHQELSSIDLDYCKQQNIDIVARPTGGRAVYHQGDITYSIVINSKLLNNGESVASSYKEISGALIIAMAHLGIEGVYIAQSKEAYTKSNACMAISTGADLEYNGKKIAGSAQYRKAGYILQHGSILVNQNFSQTARIFNLKDKKLNCTNIQDLVPQELTYETLSEAIKIGFDKTLASL